MGALILIGSLLLFLIIKLPIAFSLGLSSIITAMYMNIPAIVIAQKMVEGVRRFFTISYSIFYISRRDYGARRDIKKIN